MMKNKYGSPKFIKNILDTSGPNALKNPLLFLMQYLGFFVFSLVFYAEFVFEALGADEEHILLWGGLYAAYNFVLLFIKQRPIYDNTIFRLFRQGLNIVFFSWLIAISPGQRFLIVLLYAIPIFAIQVYFQNNHLLNIAVFAASTLGLFLGGFAFTYSEPMEPVQFGVAVLLLFVLDLLFRPSVQYGVENANVMERITSELDQKLDLHDICLCLPEYFSDLLSVEKVCVLLNNYHLETDEYFYHLLKNLHIEHKEFLLDLASNSLVLQQGKRFSTLTPSEQQHEMNLLKSIFSDSIRPDSLLIEPLFGRNKKAFGQVLLSPDVKLGSIQKNLFRQICTIAGNAIENWFLYRQMKNNTARMEINHSEFAICLNEEGVIQTLVNKAKQAIPNAQECFAHRYNPVQEHLEPKISYANGTLVPWKVQDQSGFTGNLKMNLRTGIAGNALRIREPIRVGNVCQHPWFAEIHENCQIKSLLVVPLIGKNEEMLGTISVNGRDEQAFRLEDEIMLAHLAQQATLAISNLRELREIKQHGTLMRDVINQISKLNLEKSRKEICCQIVKSAVGVLGFRMARIRLLDAANKSLDTIAVAGISRKDRSRLQTQSLPYQALKPHLKGKHRYGHVYVFDHNDVDWQAFAEKHFYIPEDLRQKETGWRAYNACLAELRTQSNETLGFLSLDMPEDGTIPTQPYRLDAIEAFASLAARSLELAKAQQELVEKQNSTKSFIGKISQRLAKAEDEYSDIGELVIQTGANLLNVEGCSLFEVQNKALRMTHSNYLDIYIDRTKPVCTDARCGLTAWAAATGQTLVFNDGEHVNHPAWAGEVEHLKFLPHPKCHSLLIVPIKRGHEVVGVISLENKLRFGQVANFDQRDLDDAEFLANQVALSSDVVDRYQLIKKWERFGLEDDLHALKNYYHFGVVITNELILKYMRKGNIEKSVELLEDMYKKTRIVESELDTLYATITRKYLEKANIREALRTILDVWEEILYHQKKYPEDLPIQLICPEDLSLPPVVRVSFLKIAAEAITNALFYSGILEDPSIKISVMLRMDDRNATLEVVDNGRGFDKTVEGYGILRMKDFVRTLNQEMYTTRFTVESEAGDGTQISCISDIRTSQQQKSLMRRDHVTA